MSVRANDICGMHEVQFQVTGTTDWDGRDNDSASVDSGRFVFRDKLRPGYWPIVHSIAVYAADDDQAGVTAIPVEFGFVPSNVTGLEADGSINHRPVYVIFSENLAPQTAPTRASAINTNWGMGWIVPSYGGIPMAFYLTSGKDEQTLILNAQIQWSWIAIGDLR